MHWRTDIDLSNHSAAFNVTKCGRRVLQIGEHPEDFDLREGEASPVALKDTTSSVMDPLARVDCVPCLSLLLQEFPSNTRLQALYDTALRALYSRTRPGQQP